MRTLILIAAMSVLATQAVAGQPRSLSLATTEPAQSVATPKTQTADIPKAAVTAPATTPAPATTATSTPTTPVAPAPATRAETQVLQSKPESSRPKHRKPSLEARVIRELHRYGIYW